MAKLGNVVNRSSPVEPLKLAWSFAPPPSEGDHVVEVDHATMESGPADRRRVGLGDERVVTTRTIHRRGDEGIGVVGASASVAGFSGATVASLVSGSEATRVGS